MPFQHEMRAAPAWVDAARCCHRVKCFGLNVLAWRLDYAAAFLSQQARRKINVLKPRFGDLWQTDVDRGPPFYWRRVPDPHPKA